MINSRILYTLHMFYGTRGRKYESPLWGLRKKKFFAWNFWPWDQFFSKF